MKNPLKTTTLSILFLLSTILVTPSPVQGDASNPSQTISVGDWWKYEVQTDLIGLTLRGTITQTIESEERVLTNNTPVDTHKLVLAGSGAVTGVFQGLQLTGTWSLTGAFHQRKTDQAEISTEARISVSVPVQGITLIVAVFIEVENSSPDEIYQFPLSVGKSWTTFTQTTVRFSSSQFPEMMTVSLDRTIDREVASSQLLTVPAGTYETYLVTGSDSSGTYTENYYSPQVEASVKNVEYNATTREVLTSQVLVDYSAWTHRSSISVPYILQNYAVTIQADTTISNTRHGTGTITFQVSGPDSVTGKGRVTIPTGLNQSRIQVHVDGDPVSAQISKNSTHYQVQFNFQLSTHTVTITYATGLQALILGQNLLAFLTGGIVSIIAILAIVLLMIIKDRRRPAMPPTPTAPPASPPPTEQPASTPPAQQGPEEQDLKT